MILFRPLIRYADFKGRASRGEYWGFGFLQTVWYVVLIVLTMRAMEHGDGHPSPGLIAAFGVIVLSMVALIVPNYAVLTRRLHDSGKGAIWLCLMLPSVASSVLTAGTIGAAVSSVGLGADKATFMATALAGLGAAGLLGLVGMICQTVLVVLTLLPGTRGENNFGPDPRDPTARQHGPSGEVFDGDRWDDLIAEAKRGVEEEPYKPVFDFGSGPAAAQPMQAPTRQTVDWAPASNGLSPAPTFGRRRA